MKRLTEMEPTWIDDELYMSACEPSDETVDEIYRRLKYYEDAEEQGRLVVLPCRVGDIVFVMRFDIGIYERGTIIYFSRYENQLISGIRLDGRTTEINIRYFDQSVFLTKEEAEAALEKMKK
jgi:hypothetical protein